MERALATVDRTDAYCSQCGKYTVAFGTTSEGTYNSICSSCGYDWLRDYYMPQILKVAV